jgi:hypothetical protein
MAPLHVIRSHPDPSAARFQQRDVAAGRLVRVGHGAFVDRADWDAATEWDRHIVRVVAASGRSPRLVASHASAVVLHRLPWIAPVPGRPTMTDPARTTSQRTRFVDKIAAPVGDRSLMRVEGVLVTGPVDTAVDVSVRYDRARALAVADAVVRRGTPQEALLDRYAGRPTVRAHSRARQVLDLATGLSESAGESVALLVMRDVGCPPPVQQQLFHDAAGVIGRVDFWFPDQGVVVEFDGLVKYRDPSMRGGRSAEDVVVAEKIREDRLRAVPGVRHVVRPIWRDVVAGGRFPAMLAESGLPVRRGVRATPAW